MNYIIKKKFTQGSEILTFPQGFPQNNQNNNIPSGVIHISTWFSTIHQREDLYKTTTDKEKN